MDQRVFPFLSEKEGGTLLAVYVQPKAARNEFAGLFQDRLKIRVCAPPVEGEANKACMSFLAGVLGISKSEIKLVRGPQSRQKTFHITKPPDFVSDKLVKAGFVS